MKPFNSFSGADFSLESKAGEHMTLPSKNKKENKGKNQLKTEPKLSKSQKRKLKKLEEEKEKDFFLSKSIETLEKCKIRDEAYLLILSSRNMGQVETHREKRRREVEFSKAGFKLPICDQPSIKKRTNKPSMKKNATYASLSLEENKDNIRFPAAINGNESDDMQSSLARDFAHVTCNKTGVLSAKEVVDEVTLSMPEQSQKPIDLSNKEEIMLTEKVDEEPKHDLKRKNSQDRCSPARNRVAPTVIHVLRPKDVEDQRMDLPIIMMEQEIMEAINENMSVIVCGATGCGKTTQVPQFLYEAGFGSKSSNTRGGIIGVTQPRRVAVFQTAKRVAFELGVRLGKEVGFQVRHDRSVGENCAIKFMTDGILLREVQSDFLLKRYSVLILDEAHERSQNTEILIGMLSKVIQLRQEVYEEQQKVILGGTTIKRDDMIYPLKLVLMSATLRIEDFASNEQIFPNPPPVIEVPTRQYPVTSHFSKKTDCDYIGQAFKKILSIHKRLPPGGILVFVTGQREVKYLCRKLRRASQEIVAKVAVNKNSNEDSSVREEEKLLEENVEAFEFQEDFGNELFGSYMDEDQTDFSDDESLDNSYDSSAESDLEFFSNDEITSKPVEPDANLLDISGLKAAFESFSGRKDVVDQTPESNSIVKQDADENKVGPLNVLPLYAMLPASSHLRVFEASKDGERLVVVATNVAETSLTIPGIKYVVDTGREKTKIYDSSNGTESYKVQWISKASAAQRAGRAGRTGPGHCYRLYSSAAFNNGFPDFSSAEILKVPVDGAVLFLKSMHFVKVANFPFPTPPETTALIEAEHRLKVLEALDKEGRITPLGKAMARYPMSPRNSKMLLTVIQIMHKTKGYPRANLILAYAVSVAAALSSTNSFETHFGENENDTDESKPDKEEKQSSSERIIKASSEKFSNPTSDALSIAYALQCFEISRNQREFCSENLLHHKTMEEMSKLRKQLLRLVFTWNVADTNHEFSWAHGKLDDVEESWAVSYDKNPLLPNEEEIIGQAICAGWADRVAKRVKGGSKKLDCEKPVSGIKYQACMVTETVFLNRRSSTYRTPPEFLVYSELLRSKRPYIHGATSVKPDWLIRYAQHLCTFSAPLADPKPFYDRTEDRVFSWVSPSFGQYRWQLPLHALPTEDKETRVAVFGFALLDGQVLPCMKDVRKFMVAPPASVLKHEAWGLKRVGNLLGKLNSKGRVIDCCEKLRSFWEEDTSKLFPEIQDWFQEGFRAQQFEHLRAEMLRQVALDSKKRFSSRKRRKI